MTKTKIAVFISLILLLIAMPLISACTKEVVKEVVVPKEVPVKPVTLQTEPAPLEIDLQRTAIMVIDMQNAFASKGGFFDLMGMDISATQQIIQPVNDICDAARAKQMKVIYTAHVYPSDLRECGNPTLAWWHKDQSVGMYQEHPEWRDKMMIRGTWGADIMEEVEPQGGDLIVEKHKASAFFQTNLDVTLKTLGIKYLVFIGIGSNICLGGTLRDAYYRGYFPILVSDASIPAGPPSQHDAAIFDVKLYYGWVTTTADILAAMR